MNPTPEELEARWMAQLEPEWLDWYRRTPLERLEASFELWQQYVDADGDLNPDVDPQSPFWSGEELQSFAAAAVTFTQHHPPGVNLLPSTAFICGTMRAHGVSCRLMGGLRPVLPWPKRFVHRSTFPPSNASSGKKSDSSARPTAPVGSRSKPNSNASDD